MKTEEQKRKHAQYMREYWAKNPQARQKQSARKKAQREKNGDSVREKEKKSRVKNRKKLLQRKKQYRQKTPKKYVFTIENTSKRTKKKLGFGRTNIAPLIRIQQRHLGYAGALEKSKQHQYGPIRKKLKKFISVVI